MSYEIPLVHEIEKRPCLYNHTMPEYNRKDVLDEAWSEIAAIVNLSVYECKDKWKNIRSSFVRSLRQTNGGRAKRPYYLTKYLHFLLPYLKPLGVDLSNIEIADISYIQPQITMKMEQTEDEMQHDMFSIKVEADYETEQHTDPLDSIPIEVETPATPPNMRQRRHMQTKSYTTTNQKTKHRKLLSHGPSEKNAIKYFLLSLLPELDSMDEEQVRSFKIRVMMLVEEIKRDERKVRPEYSNAKENTRLQKRLINLLLKNLEKND